MGTEKIKIDSDLMVKVRQFAKLSGYSSPEEFIQHCLERELSSLEESGSEDEIKKKLKGLGYIG
ncbi:MAG: hypothetical protein NTW38_05050 [Candidatus Aminicenantes bacterium]|nr:hypothetical protein [Candidatus Aminicenantes bacterium]